MLRLARLLFAALALSAIGRQLYLHVAASYSVVNFFSYFTNLSNLFAAAVLLLAARPGTGPRLALLRYLAVVNMVVVGVVFALLLRNTDLGGLLPWVNVVLHYVMPVVVLADWLLDPPVRFAAQPVRRALVLPLVYLAYVLARGALTGWYPYPFLNPANVGGYAGVAAYCAGITAVFLLVAWALRPRAMPSPVGDARA